MADQTYNLTQTGAEVQAIINDANGVKGAGATTSLTTDYIMLKDTSGAYHKIQKSSFTEAVRNTLASLLVNNDKGTTISQIAAIASGDFGSVTPANLASVLGGINSGKTISGQDSGEDYNNYKAPGYYKIVDSYTIANAPSTDSSFRHGYMIVDGWSDGRSVQTLFLGHSVQSMWQRTFNGSAWTFWYRFDNFGANTASELASLLGGVTKEITSVTDTDLNNYKTGGVFFCNNDNSKQISNLPYVTDSNGLGFTLVVFNGGIYKFQILSANNDSNFYIRNMTGAGVWNGWRIINTTAVS